MKNLNESVIYIKNNKVIYNDLEYDYQTIKDKLKNSAKRIVVILNEDIYVKRIEFNRKQSIDNFISNEFGEDEDYLFHYYYLNNKKEVVIYAVKGGNLVLSLCEGIKKVKIIPVQIHIIKILNKLIKSKNWKVIFQFKGSYYYISYLDNYIKSSYVEQKIIDILEKVNEENDFDNMYIDSNISNVNLRNTSKVNLGEYLNERAFQKQRFFAL